MFDDNSPAFLLVGYGANRTVESSDSIDLNARRKSRLLRYERVAGLFEEHTTLIPLTAWLPKMRESNPGRYTQVINLIDRLLPAGTGFEGRYENGKYQFFQDGLIIALDAMSDGYRAYLSWICDLIYHICMGAPSGAKLVDNAGIVLIDEVDLHLHPEWQRLILPTLSKVLPNLQFICTTHSPIVVGTVSSANLHLLKRDANGGSVLERPDVEVHGLNADQILLTPAFGLTSSRAPSFVEEMQEVSKQARDGDSDEAMRLTRMLASGAAASESRSVSKRPEWIEEVAQEQKG